MNKESRFGCWLNVCVHGFENCSTTSRRQQYCTAAAVGGGHCHRTMHIKNSIILTKVNYNTMPSNALVCLSLWSESVDSGVLVAVSLVLCFLLVFVSESCTRLGILSRSIFRSPSSLIENHPHFCTRSRSKTLDRKMLLGNRQNPIA